MSRVEFSKCHWQSPYRRRHKWTSWRGCWGHLEPRISDRLDGLKLLNAIFSVHSLNTVAALRDHWPWDNESVLDSWIQPTACGEWTSQESWLLTRYWDPGQGQYWNLKPSSGCIFSSAIASENMTTLLWKNVCRVGNKSESSLLEDHYASSANTNVVQFIRDTSIFSESRNTLWGWQ